MSAYRAQARLDAPLEDVWALVGNPATYPRSTAGSSTVATSCGS